MWCKRKQQKKNHHKWLHLLCMQHAHKSKRAKTEEDDDNDNEEKQINTQIPTKKKVFDPNLSRKRIFVRSVPHPRTSHVTLMSTIASQMNWISAMCSINHIICSSRHSKKTSPWIDDACDWSRWWTHRLFVVAFILFYFEWTQIILSIIRTKTFLSLLFRLL